MKFIIEHLEPELYDWCIIEYRHISKMIGKTNLIFTNIQKKDVDKLIGLGDVKCESVARLNLKNACVLDPESKVTLTSSDKKFDYIILGGILGDNPPKKRTGPELTSKLNAETRNLGKEQMSTDTAAYVAKQIIDGKSLKDFKFQDTIEIPIAEGEAVILPYRYVLEDGKPLLPDGLAEYLRERDEF